MLFISNAYAQSSGVRAKPNVHNYHVHGPIYFYVLYDNKAPTQEAKGT